MRAQHDALGKDVLAHLLEDEGTVEKEKVVAPKDSQRIDLVFTPDAEKRARRDRGQACLRLIRRMTLQTCMFELFSSALSVTVILLGQRKQISMLDELLVHARRRGGPRQRPVMPVQWILSPGRPRRALAALGFRGPADWPQGFYRGAPGYKVWLVALNELPKTRETLALRLLGTGRTRLAALTEVGTMAADDPERPVLLALVGWIRYVIGENRKVAERLSKEPEFMQTLREGFEQWMEAQQKLAAARAIREVRRESRAEGKAEGKAEGEAVGKAAGKAESLLKILFARQISVSKKLRAQILKCGDEEKLDRWIERAVVADSAAVLLEMN